MCLLVRIPWMLGRLESNQSWFLRVVKPIVSAATVEALSNTYLQLSSNPEGRSTLNFLEKAFLSSSLFSADFRVPQFNLLSAARPLIGDRTRKESISSTRPAAYSS